MVKADTILQAAGITGLPRLRQMAMRGRLPSMIIMFRFLMLREEGLGCRADA